MARQRLEIKRGDVVIVAPFPPFGKPPALVVQAQVSESNENVTLALISSDLTRAVPVRIPVAPSTSNGLQRVSDVMVDLIVTVPLTRVSRVAGTLEANMLQRVDAAIRVYLGL